MHIPYFSILDWLSIIFFIILFILLSLLVAQSKNTKIVIGGIFASFLVTLFGAILSFVIIEKYTKHASFKQLESRRILFNETMFISGYIKNDGKYPLNYCKLDFKLVNTAKDMYKKGTFFKSGGLNLFGSKEKEEAKPQIIRKIKFITFTPPLRPNFSHPFSIVLKYPGYFRNALIIKKLYCH